MKEYISPNDPRFFGADDSQTIQNAIAAAEEDGCRKIVIPRYNARTDSTQWRIPVSIKLPSDFTVVLDNCYMVQETGVYDNMFINSKANDLSCRNLAGEQKNIALIGVGNVVLDGGVHNHLLEKTNRKFGMPSLWSNNLILWINVSGIRMENLHIRNHRWWAINHIFCRNVVIKNIEFYAIPHVRNMDGIDLRIGCNHFEIENITGRTGDDVIAMSALLGRGETERLVEGKDIDIHDIKLRNIKGDPHTCMVVRLLNHDGAKIYNIDMDTVMDSSDYTTKRRTNSVVGIGSAIYFKKHPAELGDTHHITARNLTSRSGVALNIWRTLSDSTFQNVRTFGDNQDGMYFHKGDFRNVTVENFYYGSTQQEMFCSKDLSPENYVGTILTADGSKGDITLKNLHIDKVRDVFRISGGLHVNVEGMEKGTYSTLCRKDAQSAVTIDGEVIENG